VSYQDHRRDYTRGGLHRSDLSDNPMVLFEQWLQQAIDAELGDPTGMVLATVDPAGMVWQRMVLLKDVSPGKGFVFFTNYASDKAAAIEQNPRVSLHFPWNELDRQVIVGGVASKISVAETARYFLSRPRESQIAAWASQQSRPISARAVLEQQLAAMQAKFAQGSVPVPDFWGGYRVVPDRIEFWQGGVNRLHDRFRYTKNQDDQWQIEQLQP
jgi:pyridoxamine 5'-phosphate oxidase